MSSENTIHGDVGIVAEGDVIQNNSNVIHLAAPTFPAIKPLIDAQRSHLNELVRKIIELKPETPRWQIWKGVHREVGADSIDQMTTAQYPEAVSCLHRIIDSCDEEAQCQLMVRRVIALTQDSKGLFDRAVTWCIDHYGKDRFLDLDRHQLRELLLALPGMEQGAPVACNHDCSSCRAHTRSQHEAELSRNKVVARNRLHNLQRANDAKLASHHGELVRVREWATRKVRQREQKLRAHRDRVVQWFVAGILAGTSGGMVVGVWLF